MIRAYFRQVKKGNSDTCNLTPEGGVKLTPFQSRLLMDAGKVQGEGWYLLNTEGKVQKDNSVPSSPQVVSFPQEVTLYGVSTPSLGFYMGTVQGVAQFTGYVGGPKSIYLFLSKASAKDAMDRLGIKDLTIHSYDVPKGTEKLKL